MKEINKCCCFSLRTGGIIIGWLDVLSLLLVPICIILLIDGIPPELKEFDIDQKDIIGTLVECPIGALMGVLLLIGIYKERQVLLKTWLIYNAVVVALASIEYIIEFIGLLSVDAGAAFESLIGSALGLALGFYMWWAIYSLRKRMIYNKQPDELASGSNI